MNDDELTDRLRRALHTEADMLTPHQGTPRVTPVAVRHRRRVRARTTAYVCLAAAAAVAAAVVIGVNVVGHHSPSRVNVSGGPPARSAQAHHRLEGGAKQAIKGPRATPTTTPASGASNAAPTTTAAPAVQTTPQVASTFVPLSATFVSLDDGWVLGVQYCESDVPCLKLDTTTSRGGQWTAIDGPSIAGLTMPDAADSYTRPDLQVRFASPAYGWVFGNVDGSPVLYSTTNGGSSWTQDSLSGLGVKSIVDVETAARNVQLAYVSSSGGIGVATSAVITSGGTPSWTVPSFSQSALAKTATSAQLVVQGTGGWVIETNPAGEVVGGAQLVNGGWQHWTPACNGDQGGILAASTASNLIAVCGASGQQTLEKSGNGGSSFTSAGVSVGSTDAISAASSASTLALLGLSNGNVMYVSTGGATNPATLKNPPANQTVQEIGFESDTDGIAITGNDGSGMLFVTADGGQSWQQVPLSS